MVKKKMFPIETYETVSIRRNAALLRPSDWLTRQGQTLKYVVRCYKAAYLAGADGLYVYDGPGCASPETIEYIVKLVRAISGGQVEIIVHCHNDFGLATANSIAAVKAGATLVDAVVNGLGDRAGNAPFEEVVTALEVLYNVRTGIDISKITEISKMVSDIYKILLRPIKRLLEKTVIGMSAILMLQRC